MPPSDRDIDATALLMIKRYGDNASLEASLRADRLIEIGAVAGQSMWKRVIAAIYRLQADPPAGSAVH
jgi:hypothetical protein